jgi:hypothetical protein
MFEQAWSTVLNRPELIFLASAVVLWVPAYLGAHARSRWRPLKTDEHETVDVVLRATLTLLGLVIGFSFSMAEGRYDQRKNYEQEEANAIGTEFFRAELLPSNDAATIKDLLRRYLDQRIGFYQERHDGNLDRIDAETTELQREMWSVVRSDAQLKPIPTVLLALAGMNEVVNSQGYTQAAWWYRIPEGAWAFMAAISIVSCALIGYRAKAARLSLLVLVPLGLSAAFFFVADIDSPRHGVIPTAPHNLMRLSQTLPRH